MRPWNQLRRVAGPAMTAKGVGAGLRSALAMPAVIRTPGVLMAVKAAPEQRWVMSYEDTLVQVRENFRDIYGMPVRNTLKTRNDMADAVAYALDASRLPKTFVEAIADRMRARFSMPSHSVRDGQIYASVSYGDNLNSINLLDPRNFVIGDGYIAIVPNTDTLTDV